MRCFILRHAEKETGDFYNPRLRHQDEPLSAKGRRDAQKLPTFFLQQPVSAIYVSGYQRTWQTIEPLAEQLQLVPTVDERLNEIDNGRLEGMTEAAIQETYPEIWQAFVAKTADFRFPGGETGLEAQARLLSFLHDMEQGHPDETIVLASHEGLIRLLACTILHAPVYARWNLRVDYCGITEIAFEQATGRWTLIRFNQANV